MLYFIITVGLLVGPDNVVKETYVTKKQVANEQVCMTGNVYKESQHLLDSVIIIGNCVRMNAHEVSE